jgi:hypothetical protein
MPDKLREPEIHPMWTCMMVFPAMRMMRLTMLQSGTSRAGSAIFKSLSCDSVQGYKVTNLQYYYGFFSEEPPSATSLACILPASY